METKRLVTLKRLYLTIAIVMSAFIIPVFGTIMNLFFAMFSVTIIVLSAIILAKEAKVQQRRVGTYLALAGGVISLIPTLMTYITVIQVMTSPEISRLNGFAAGYEYGYSVGSQSPVGFIIMMIGVIAWGLLIAATVLNYINSSKMSKQIKSNGQTGYFY